MTTDLFSNSKRFGDMAAWREEALALHGKGPFHWIEAEGFQPFRAVIGREEILEIEAQHELFANGPEPILTRDEILALRAQGGPRAHTLIHMDEPEHRKYRMLTNDWFLPGSVRQLQPRLDELSRKAMETLERAGGEIDFNTEVALPFPLQVILVILGLPEEDYPRMLLLTQEMFGSSDPDFVPSDRAPGDVMAVLRDFFQYFATLSADRRANPTGDLATCIANGLIDGAPLPDTQSMSYYLIVTTAGHDTTSAAMSDGMRLLAENPDQLAILKRRPELIPNAVEELIRISSPVRHFMRTAREDAVVAGQPIAKGEWLLLSYPAANLDPRAFEDPLRFDVTREAASRQIAFGYGIHYCLGAHLARLEMATLFGHLLPRLESVEITGDVTTSTASFVSGIKSLPIRYKLTAA
jgi:cytochrome P450